MQKYIPVSPTNPFYQLIHSLDYYPALAPSKSGRLNRFGWECYELGDHFKFKSLTFTDACFKLSLRLKKPNNWKRGKKCLKYRKGKNPFLNIDIISDFTNWQEEYVKTVKTIRSGRSFTLIIRRYKLKDPILCTSIKMVVDCLRELSINPYLSFKEFKKNTENEYLEYSELTKDFIKTLLIDLDKNPIRYLTHKLKPLRLYAKYSLEILK